MYKNLVALSLFLVVCDGLVMEIPLRRMATSAPISRLRSAYRRPRGLLSKAFNTDPVYLDGTLGLFVGNLSLGTPPQPFLVAFDTDSADFWVVDADCTDVNCLGQPKSGYKKTRFQK
ncbi:aspartic protease 1, partial [Aphelenchoides avenae]